MNSFRLTAGSAKTKGDTDLQNDIVIFWLDDADSGELKGVCYDAEKALLPTTSGLVINAGDRVFWNDGAKKVTKTNTDRAIGWGVSRDDNADVSSANGDTDAMIRFHQEVESTTY
jgi:hypothetical protein